MESTLEEKRQFLVENPKYVIDHVSLRFPFKQEQLRKYRNLLAWDFIISNESIQWSTDIIDEFSELLLPQDEPYWPESFSVNASLPWHSIEFVKRYEHLWDWEHMAENNILKGECKAYFLSRLEQCERYEPSPNTPVIELDLDPNDPIAKRMRGVGKPTVWKPKQLDEFYLSDNYNDELIYDESIIWTLPFLKRYIQLFSAERLYVNHNIWYGLFAEFDKEENLMGVLDVILMDGFVPRTC